MDYIYDASDARSIEAYAKELVGKTFYEVIEQYECKDKEQLKKIMQAYGNIARKGGLGNLLEEVYFGYKANSNQEADFKEVGIELKVTPYEYTKKNELRAGERLVITMISYEQPFEVDFYKSHVWEKTKKMLLIYYWRNKKLDSNLLYKIGYVKLFTPPENDLIIIKQDYEIIKEKVMSGKAHELSESDTLYLGACTKGATAAKSLVPQYYNRDVLAKKRAFCFKNSYMTYILTHYIAGSSDDTEAIFKTVDNLKQYSFEECINQTISKYVGKSDLELCEMFNREYNNNKAQWVDLSYRMLEIRTNKAEEFEKANISVRAVRIEANNSIKESMSFAPFKFKTIVKQNFEDSDLYKFFDQTRLFFVVWKQDGDVYRLVGSQLWNMPKMDLEVIVREGWENTQRIIKYGVKFNIEMRKKGIIVKNNLPKKNDNKIIHVRPHTAKSAYRLEDGTEIGDVKHHANELPNGEYMTTQSFWVNNSYIIEQINCLK